MNTDRLTSQGYWEGYYQNGALTREQIEGICSIYDDFWDGLILENEACPPKTIIEIGGYPGRYLAYLSAKYGLIPTSLDFNSDDQRISDAMCAFGISKYHVIRADFIGYVPDQQYDIVISNGFIEHFNNYEAVLDEHVKYLKPGGTMFLMIPNMRYYSWFYKTLVDRANLLIHNTKCMKKEVFTSFATRNHLKLARLEYYGGFAFTVHQRLNLVQFVIFRLHRFLFKYFMNRFISRWPNAFFSSTIISILKF